ncbi:MAG: replication initiator protein A [Oscillospiraceae bacterium]|nr:replication initiator protein A [Oscillospiraceae bacterium]MBR6861759.1 replication initiator protein A [Acidaminococcaceae bacterium]
MEKAFLTDFFYGDEAEQFTFFRIPRLLITSPHFSGISVEAKLLYGLMLDRMGLSCKKGWHESDGKVYIYYTIEEICKDLNCASEKAVKLVAELEGGSQVKYRCVRAHKMENGDIVEDERKQTIMYNAGLEVGGLYSLRPGKLYRVVGMIDGQERSRISLIERRRQGQGKPTKIYVKRFTTREVLTYDQANTGSSLTRIENAHGDTITQQIDNRNTRISENEIQEIGESKFRGFDNRNSRNSGTETQDFRLPNGNYTDNSYTDLSHTQSVNPSLVEGPLTGEKDGPTDGEAERERIKKQIEYSFLPYRLNRWQLQQANELVELMVAVAMNRAATIKIGQAEYGTAYVRSRLDKLTCEDVETVIRNMEEAGGQVKNVRAYMLAALFNAADTAYHRETLA